MSHWGFPPKRPFLAFRPLLAENEWHLEPIHVFLHGSLAAFIIKGPVSGDKGVHQTPFCMTHNLSSTSFSGSYREDTDRVNIMNPKYFIILKWPDFQRSVIPLNQIETAKKVIVPFITLLLAPSKPKLVDCILTMNV